MAKLPPKSDGQNGKVKVRIIEFEMEGSDLSLQESLKSIAAALSRPNVVVASRPSARIESQKGAGQAQDEDAVMDDSFVNDEYVEDSTLEASAPVVVRRQRKTSRPVAPNLVAVRFDDGNPTFAEFVADRDPRNDMQKYICAAYWLKIYKDVHEVSIDHIYTAYRSQGWALPATAIQPMRELAATRDGRFSKGIEKGHYAINHIGEGFVTTKMGRGA
ncbi:MAG: hypothetical protein EOO38_14140 [Cytophagaceae bacterium]|nr:MAG: hypothetical protein EOO38_14140 [Cytophagaceae bacterium]